MIFTERKITVRKGKSSIDESVILYRGDFEVELRFTIMEAKYRFKSGVNLVDSEKASHAQLALLAPDGTNVFTEVGRCEDGTAIFVLSKEMIDELSEVGLYSFQIRLFDYYKESRITIPPVEFGIEVREPIAAEDHTNAVDDAMVGYSIAKTSVLDEPVPETFNGIGQYNKTNWETGDRISEGKLNKIEDAIDKINQNEKNDVADLDKRVTNNFNVLSTQMNLKASNTDLETQKNRIDNIAKLESGSTTGDAELMDCRIGFTGVEYDSAGEAIREQNKTLNDAILNVMEYAAGNFNYEKIKIDVGFLMTNGKFSTDPSIKGEYTNKIACKAGWKFLYKGRGDAQAASWLLYSGDKLVTYGQANTYDKYVEVTIPSNIDGVVFASYAGINGTVELEVQFASIKSITHDNIDSSLSEFIRYNHLQPDFSAVFPTRHVDVDIEHELTVIDGKYLHLGGGLATANTYKVHELSVHPGEHYYLSCTTMYELAPYAFYNTAGEVIELGGDGVSSGTLKSWVFDDIKVPTQAVKLRICSGNGQGATNFRLTRLTVDKIASINEIDKIVDNSMDTHKYRNTSEYKSILGDYEVVNKEAYMNASGNFISDKNSQYVKSIRIREYRDLYITAQAQYNTCIMAIRDENGTFLGAKGSAQLEGGTQTWEMKHFVVDDLLAEYPTAYYMDLCNYPYPTKQLSVLTTDGTFYDLVDKVNNLSGGSNVLYGKKWVACGDSFTEGDFSGYTDPNGLSGKNSPELYDPIRGMYKTYPWWIAERNNMVLINEAKCGSTMALSKEYLNGTNSDINYRNPFSLNRYKAVPLDTDYLTLWFGLNETSTPLGTLQDTTNETILGAWNIVLEYFITNMPYCKIGIVISHGGLNDTFANGIISVAEYWGIPYLDTRNNPQVPLMLGGRGGQITLNSKARSLRNNAFYVTSSNGHPNLKAHEYQSTFIEHWLRSL